MELAERYRLITENALECIWCLDALSGEFVYISPSIFRLRGLTVEEAMKEKMEDSLTPESLSRARATLEKSVMEMMTGKSSGNIEQIGEFRQYCKDGSIKDVEISTILTANPVTGRLEVIGVSRDISNRKAVEAELEKYRSHLEEMVHQRTLELAQARDQAEAANRAKDAFLSTMSHELRTPLSQIMGMTYLLAKDAESEKARQRLEKLDAASRHMLDLINDILDFSSLEAEVITLAHERFELSEIMRAAAEEVAGQAKAKGLEIELNMDPSLGTSFSGDARRIQQLLRIHLDNAVKYSHRGMIRCTATRDGTLDGNMRVRFEIADQGIGIAPEVQKRLFTRFSQGDNSLTRRYEGIGLGLPLAQRLVRLMGGEYGYSSEKDVGSSFWFSIPLAAAAGNGGAQ